MSVKQPDPRIPLKGLGIFPVDGRNYVSHGESGCPRNAVIEFVRDHLRCNFCYKALTQDAAIHVLDHSDMTEQNTFTWRRGDEPLD